MSNEEQRKRLIELLSKPIFPKIGVDPAEVVADYLLDNGLIVTPCKVGDTVYAYCADFGVVLPYFIENLSIGFMGKEQNYFSYEANCHAEETDELLDEIDFDLDDIGKTVFLTPEDAERALAERNEP